MGIQLKLGQEVKIMAKASSGENGWLDTWQEEMDSFVGKKGFIMGLEEDKQSAAIKFDSGEKYNFPFHILETQNDISPIIFKSELKLSDIKPGALIRVTRKALAFENGWDNDWPDIMDAAIGQICEFDGSGNGATGYGLLFYSFNVKRIKKYFPPEVLEIITSAPGKEIFVSENIGHNKKLLCIADLYYWIYESNSFNSGKSYGVVREDNINIWIEDERKRIVIFSKEKGIGDFIGDYFETSKNKV